MEGFSVGLGFTANCNMNCPFCYSKEKRYEARECDLEDWYQFFDKNHSLIEAVNYGTSENSTCEDWYALISYINNKYSKITQAVTTNGYLGYVAFSDDGKSNIIHKCIEEIDVSLDYASPQRHNYFRGNPKAYEWVMSTLRFCNERNIRSTIVMLGIEDTLNEKNVESIFEIAERFHSIIRVNLYRPVSQKAMFTPPSLEKICWLFDWVEKNHIILSVSDPLFSSIFFEKYMRLDPSGISSIRILQNGDIFPSTYLLSENLKMGNIREFSLDRIDTNAIYKMVKNLTIPNDCVDCDYKKSCRGGALDRRYLWYKSFAERDPYCLFRAENIDLISRLPKCHISEKGFHSVHDSYLPTLFFQP